MNKQNVLDYIHEELMTHQKNSSFQRGYRTAMRHAYDRVKQLDEPVKPPEPEPWQPEKPIVPQFVADWYEDNEDGFEFNLYTLCLDYNNCEVDKKLSDWFCDKHNKLLETLVNMHQFGYEVEKEKLYTVFQLATKEYLFRFHTGVLEGLKVSKKHAQKIKDYHFTQAELEELQYWDNPAFEIEEVKR